MANPNIPYVAGWKAKITRIKKIWMQPCDINPIIWALGYFAATPAIIYGLVKPDCLDATFDRIGRKHRKRRKASWSPEGMASPLPAPKGGIQWYAWRAAQWAQRAGFWAIIIDGTFDWVIHGTSFAFQLSGCEDPNQGYATVEASHVLLEGEQGVPNLFDEWIPTSAHIFTAGSEGINTPQGHAIGVGLSVTQNLGLWPLPDARLTFVLYDAITDEYSPELEPKDIDANTRGISWSSPTMGAADKRHAYRLLTVKHGEGVVEISAFLQVSGVNLESFETDMCGHSTKQGS